MRGIGVLFLALVAACSGPPTGLSNKVVAANGAAVADLTVLVDAEGRAPRVALTHGLLRKAGSERSGDRIRHSFIAGLLPGREVIVVHYPDRILRYPVTLVASTEDSDGDGFPDVVELRDAADRERFRKWFCMVAEGQFANAWARWEPAQRDCAGLVRFAYIEALKRHDGRWFRHSGRLLETPPADVRAYAYPDIPLVGTAPFRITPPRGAFSTNDFSSFASARYLLAHNTRFVSRQTANALPGDLLFYRQEEDGGDRFEDSMHIMVVLPRGKVVYHTGNPKSGRVRRLALSVLSRHPDWRWRPSPGNPNFLGVYRFLILEERAP